MRARETGKFFLRALDSRLSFRAFQFLISGDLLFPF